MAKKIDSRIYMPPVEGYEYKETLSGADSNADEIDLDLPAPTPDGLQPPEHVQIVEQIYRKDAAGRSVVDLIIEVEDMPGATEYEIRTSVV